MLPDDLVQRLVEQMRGGVVRHRREAHGPRHDGADAVAGGETVTLEEQRLVVAEAVRRAQLARAPVSSCSMKPASVTCPPPSG